MKYKVGDLVVTYDMFNNRILKTIKMIGTYLDLIGPNDGESESGIIVVYNDNTEDKWDYHSWDWIDDIEPATKLDKVLK